MALSATPDYICPRGDTIDVGIRLPGSNLTGGTIRATLKQKLDDTNNDDLAFWKADFNPSDPTVCDDPTTGIANVRVPPGDASTPGTYKAKPEAVAYLDIEVTLASGAPRKSRVIRVLFTRDGTRRTS